MTDFFKQPENIKEEEPLNKENEFQKEMLSRLKSIDNNIQFFFWFTVLGILLYAFIVFAILD